MTADHHDVSVQVVQYTMDLFGQFDPEMTAEDVWLCGTCRRYLDKNQVQGLSLDKAVIDLGRNVFAHGQAYVALSRVRNLEGCHAYRTAEVQVEFDRQCRARGVC